MASNAENVFIWWRHHVSINTCRTHDALISYQFGAERVQMIEFNENSRTHETN